MSLHELINDSTQLVDVRTREEFAMGHIKNALNIPLADIAKRKQEIKGLGTKPVVIYCRSGNRSGMAVAYLQNEGYSYVYNGGSMDDVQKMLARKKINQQ